MSSAAASVLSVVNYQLTCVAQW